MRIQRTLPPAAAPITPWDALRGLGGFFAPKGRLAHLEAEMRQYFGVKHVFLVSSGKTALALILRALASLSPRRTVVIPDYTCFSVPSAICRAGLSVSVCDIDPETLDFDFARLGECLDNDTLCVLPTHLFGLPADVARLRRLAREQLCFVVEDAAQAMGEIYDGELLGTLGDVGFLSLGRGKNITCGSGGIVLTDSDSIAAALRLEYARLKPDRLPGRLRRLVEALAISVLIHPRVYWLPDGLPFLKLGETRFDPNFPTHIMDGVGAAILTRWTERLEFSRRARRVAAQALVDELPFPLQAIGSQRSEETAYLRLPVLLPDAGRKERLTRLSRRAGLGISPFYPTPIHAIEGLKASRQGSDCPAATMVAQRLVTLPVHHLVAAHDRRKIASAIRLTMDGLETANTAILNTSAGKQA